MKSNLEADSLVLPVDSIGSWGMCNYVSLSHGFDAICPMSQPTAKECGRNFLAREGIPVLCDVKDIRKPSEAKKKQTGDSANPAWYHPPETPYDLLCEELEAEASGCPPPVLAPNLYLITKATPEAVGLATAFVNGVSWDSDQAFIDSCVSVAEDLRWRILGTKVFIFRAMREICRAGPNPFGGSLGFLSDRLREAFSSSGCVLTPEGVQEWIRRNRPSSHPPWENVWTALRLGYLDLAREIADSYPSSRRFAQALADPSLADKLAVSEGTYDPGRHKCFVWLGTILSDPGLAVRPQRTTKFEGDDPEEALFYFLAGAFAGDVLDLDRFAADPLALVLFLKVPEALRVLEASGDLVISTHVALICSMTSSQRDADFTQRIERFVSLVPDSQAERRFCYVLHCGQDLGVVRRFLLGLNFANASLPVAHIPNALEMIEQVVANPPPGLSKGCLAVDLAQIRLICGDLVGVGEIVVGIDPHALTPEDQFRFVGIFVVAADCYPFEGGVWYKGVELTAVVVCNATRFSTEHHVLLYERLKSSRVGIQLGPLVKLLEALIFFDDDEPNLAVSALENDWLPGNDDSEFDSFMERLGQRHVPSWELLLAVVKKGIVDCEIRTLDFARAATLRKFQNQLQQRV